MRMWLKLFIFKINKIYSRMDITNNEYWSISGYWGKKKNFIGCKLYCEYIDQNL